MPRHQLLLALKVKVRGADKAHLNPKVKWYLGVVKQGLGCNLLPRQRLLRWKCPGIPWVVLMYNLVVWISNLVEVVQPIVMLWLEVLDLNLAPPLSHIKILIRLEAAG